MPSKINEPRVGDMLLSTDEKVGMTIGIGEKHLYSKTKTVLVEWYTKEKVVAETYIIVPKYSKIPESSDMSLRDYNKLRSRFREKQKEMLK